MAKLPIGLVLRQIVDEKLITPAQLVEQLGISKQAVYNNFKRTDMTNADLNKWAKVLDVTPDEIINRSKGELDEEVKPGGYLQQHLESLERQFRELSEQMKTQLAVKDQQLSVKDRQIERLMDLLGKLSPAPGMSRDMELYPKLGIAV